MQKSCQWQVSCIYGVCDKSVRNKKQKETSKVKKYAFGVDIGGTTIKMGLFKTSGDLMDVWEIPTRTHENGKDILSDIAEAVDNK